MKERIKLIDKELQIVDSTNIPILDDHDRLLVIWGGNEKEVTRKKQQILDDQETVEKINRVKRDTETLLNDSPVPNKDELERVVHLLEYLLDTKQSQLTD